MEHMQAAVNEACAGVQAGDGGPFGAVVVQQGKIVATGHNMVDTFNLSGCVLYTSCYPCPMCLGACLWARFDSIYYAATAEQAAEVGFDDKVFHDFLKNPRSDQNRLRAISFENVELCNSKCFSRKLEHLPVPDSSRPFEMWAKKKDKLPY
ncbi:cytidine and deoxycytidylate deaminase zinc-binding region [Teladorsagia circumcincta]|uniref:Cytidine and deoxycytidylate deaminase zinc-binding region n=1 Tax=Teladorsagia circumcincta TaxID=45464 RepID=A0A2G9U6X8_TELCI|nr:cytidine and deoxycytidylate deaminase zinc-binding region [Teladorsagia circumcincta]